VSLGDGGANAITFVPVNVPKFRFTLFPIAIMFKEIEKKNMENFIDNFYLVKHVIGLRRVVNIKKKNQINIFRIKHLETVVNVIMKNTEIFIYLKKL